MRELSLFLLLTAVVSAALVTVLITGNFGPGQGGSTVLDNQDYSISYTILDPHTPASAFADPGNVANATYQIPVRLSIPSLGLSIVNRVAADYRSDPFHVPDPRPVAEPLRLHGTACGGLHGDDASDHERGTALERTRHAGTAAAR